MSLHVDLLLDDEKRRLGALSPRVALRVAVVLFAALGILIVRILVNVQSESDDVLNLARADWARLEPQYKEIQAQRARLARNMVLTNELSGWHTSRVSWADCLLCIGTNIPDSVQYTRLTYVGTLEQPVIAPVPEPEEGAAAAHTPPPPVKPPRRTHVMTIEVVAAGAEGGAALFSLVERLQSDPLIRDVFGLVNLGPFRAAEGGDQDGSSDRRLTIRFGREPGRNP